MTIISPDALLMVKGVYQWTPHRCAQAWEDADTLLLEALATASKLVLVVGIPASGKTTWLKENREGGAVYLDATLTKPSVRAKYIRMAGAAGVPAEAVVMLTSIGTCLKRNHARSADRLIPPHTLNLMQNQLREQPVLDSEGFTRVRVVREKSTNHFK